MSEAMRDLLAEHLSLHDLTHERLDVFEQRQAQLIALVEELVLEARNARLRSLYGGTGILVREVQ